MEANTLEQTTQFWANEGLQHIIPNTGEEFPEGFDVRPLLKHTIGQLDQVLEVGCGYGRLCRAFSPSQYIGVDVNPNAIAAARERNPDYLFEQVAPDAILPNAKAAFIYTVGLHISDEALERFLKPICQAAPVIMIAELMDTRWRRPGNPPVFNRDPEQYILTMAKLGFTLESFTKMPYERYGHVGGDTADNRITFHIYGKNKGI